eukprot:451844_1
MRVKKNENESIDAAFSNIVQVIDAKKNKLDQMQQLNTDKFAVSANNVSENGVVNDETFRDGLFEFLSKRFHNGVNRLHKIEQTLNKNEYDSDAIDLDINEDGESNLKQLLQLDHKIDFEPLRRYTFHNKLAKSTFSIGYRFYYWEYYKNKLEIDSKQDWTIHATHNDHSGYTLSELYIAKKYDSLKDEIENNNVYQLNKNDFDICLHKVHKYINCNNAKHICFENDEDILHYGIIGTVLNPILITIQHLLAVILYTDWSDLCKEFSATFRKHKPYESLEEVKKRNREYWNWSKLLRETVEIFGRNCESGLKGPFYSGMSFIMVFPEFNIRLCGPTSTSKQIEVATRFGGRDGIIIQMNNNSTVFNMFISSFACSWISNYALEDEYLFFGGRFRIRIESVRIINTHDNYGIFYKPLFYFDCMVNGNRLSEGMEKSIVKNDYLVLDKLIKHQLRVNGFKNDFTEYINNTFAAYLNYKTDIVLNLCYITELCFMKLKEFVLNSNNIINSNVFKLFCNLKKIIIYTTNNTEKFGKEYSFDLMELLEFLCKLGALMSNEVEIRIQAIHKYKSKYDMRHVGHSWIKEAFSSVIKDEFTKYRFNARLDEIQMAEFTGELRLEDCLIIKRFNL